MLPLSRTRTVDNAADRAVLLVANKGDRSMGIIDPELGHQVASVAEGDTTGHEVAASPDGRTAYVPIYGNSGVGKPGTDGRIMVVVDIPTRKVIGSLDSGHGVRPHCPVFDPNNGLLYVTTELDNSITVIDPHTLKIAVGWAGASYDERHVQTKHRGCVRAQVFDSRHQPSFEEHRCPSDRRNRNIEKSHQQHEQPELHLFVEVVQHRVYERNESGQVAGRAEVLFREILPLFANRMQIDALHSGSPHGCALCIVGREVSILPALPHLL